MSRSEPSLDVNEPTGMISTLRNAMELVFAVSISTRDAVSTCLVPRLDFLCTVASFNFLVDA
jgi:hypothetical protein